MASWNELAVEFYATQLGLSKPWPSLSDLQYLFYLGAKNGNLNLGGGGATGKSAYQSWLDLGNSGTEQDFIDSLKGADGVVANVDTTVAAQMLQYGVRPVVKSTDATNWAAYVAPSGYSGNKTYDSTLHAGHPNPSNPAVGDDWYRRTS